MSWRSPSHVHVPYQGSTSYNSTNQNETENHVSTYAQVSVGHLADSRQDRFQLGAIDLDHLQAQAQELPVALAVDLQTLPYAGCHSSPVWCGLRGRHIRRLPHHCQVHCQACVTLCRQAAAQLQYPPVSNNSNSTAAVYKYPWKPRISSNFPQCDRALN